MKLLRKLIIFLLLVILGAWFLVTPSQPINHKNQLKNLQGADISQYMGRALTHAALSTQGATSELTLSQDEFNAVLKNTLRTAPSASILLNGSYELKDGYILVKLPYQIFGLLTTQIELELVVTLKDQVLSVEVDKARIGKIPLLKTWVEQLVKDSIQKIPTASVSKTSIQLPLPKTASLLRSIQIRSNQLTLGVVVDQEDLLSLGLSALLGENARF